MARKLAPSLEKLNRHLLRMNRRVAAAVDRAIRCLTEQDEALAREVIAGEDAIDNEEVRIEQACLDLLAESQLPAEQVRYVLCLIKINSDLERIADCALNIAERLEGFVRREAPALPQDLRILANSACGMLRDAVRAWVAQSPDAALEVLRADEIVDALYDQLARDVTESLTRPTGSTRHYLDYLLAARDFERIADHATNIAECAIHSATGRIVRHQDFKVEGV